MNVNVALGLFIAGTFLLRAAGILAPAVVGDIDDWGLPLTAAVLASLVVTATFGADGTLVIDARIAGLAVAAVAAALRASLLVTLVSAMAGTALIRLLT